MDEGINLFIKFNHPFYREKEFLIRKMRCLQKKTNKKKLK